MSTERWQWVTTKEVVAMTGISRSQIWRLRKAGRFPAPARISAQSIRYFRDDVIAYMESYRGDNGAPTNTQIEAE